MSKTKKTKISAEEKAFWSKTKQQAEVKPPLLPGERRTHMHLALPYPPSLNSLYVPYRGRMIISKEARKYHDNMAKILAHLGHPGMTEEFLEADVWVCPPDRRQRDVDNVLKCLFDALQRCGVYKNDAQVKRVSELTMDYWPFPDGAVIVKLVEIDRHDYEREGNGELLEAYRAARLAVGLTCKPEIPRPKTVTKRRKK